ncbi:beta-ketoacyl synthase N-terminal-like domain-containing protein, partial [Rhizobium sp.]|uniref:beta-ketoacyl synthase N-terminal-like domain-containing protein n=1 Tax=Rhizobium sp. TaxID=391 RepID=UPI000E8E11B4|nr:hypothetical protein [Rhizobium sp.]
MKHEHISSFETIVEQYARGALDPFEAQALLESAREDVSGVAHVDAPTPYASSHTVAVDNHSIAVIGMSGEFPGAPTIAQFQRNLMAGRMTAGLLPEPYLQGEGQPYRWGGVLSERDSFDPAFFGIPVFEAHSMSAHQRLVLRESWRAIENAGVDPHTLRGESVGVFVGVEPTGYVHQTLTGASDAVIAGRVSYLLNFSGPALVINTACSSSLVAIHVAAESLRSGECKIALAGGVYADLNQRTLAALAQSGMLSPNGECKTFDSAANGTVFSEGIAMFALKRLKDALADGDPIHGIIRGTGVNHDGASNGLTAPSGEAQERLLNNVYRRFEIDPARISYIEAHGTGTKLGDPIEANALARTFGALVCGEQSCRVGSAKAFIGHAGAASGAIGLVKALLGLKLGAYFGMPDFQQINPMIDFGRSPCEIDSRCSEWPRQAGSPRMAAVTSLGISGTNAHLVVEEFLPEQQVEPNATGRFIVPLSAQGPDRLKLAAQQLAEALAPSRSQDAIANVVPGPSRLELADLSRTIAELLQVDGAMLDVNETLDQFGFEAGHMIRLGERLSSVTGERLDLSLVPATITLGALKERLDALLGTSTAVVERSQPLPLPGSVEQPGVTLQQVAWTLQTGRAAMADRVVFIVDSLDELVAGLHTFVASGADGRTCFAGTIEGSPPYGALLGDSPDMQAMIANWFQKGELERLAQLWVIGMPLQWPQAPCRRISLPGYPFATGYYGKHLEPAAVTSPPVQQVVAQQAKSDVVATASVSAQPQPPVVVQEENLADAVGRWLVGLIADTVGTPADVIDVGTSLENYGVDSIARTRMNHLLAQTFPEASHTLLFEYSVLSQLAAFLAGRFPDLCRAALAAANIQLKTKEPEPAPAKPAETATAITVINPKSAEAPVDRIAIIGMSARFPKAPDIQTFWSRLMAGETVIDEIPADRWDWREHYSSSTFAGERFSKSHSKWGAFLEGHQQFDAAFFNFMPIEARNMDPQERVFLQECWKALEDAGYAPGKMPAAMRARAGVFAGASKHGFELMGAEEGLELARTSFGALVNRVSYVLDFGGPSEATNTACSSSLVALNRACEAIRSGQCDLALVGGVNLYLHPSTYVELTVTRMLSDRADCAAFGANANGIVPGEGVAVIVLKPLEKALADGDHIHATILASAVNHSGRTSGYTTPNPNRQADVIRAAIAQSGIDPRSISYIESSANGSEIGDAVEMSALAKVFDHRTNAVGHYGVGSIKPNFGHGEAVSGMAQLIKVVEALKRRRLPPTLQPQAINPAINFKQLPFDLQTGASEWVAPMIDGVAAPLRAGITSIGAGGVNAHVIIEEAPIAYHQRRGLKAQTARLFILSARSAAQLRSYAQAWRRFMTTVDDADLGHINHTLQMGREEFQHRLAILADEASGISLRLGKWLDGDVQRDVFHAEAAKPRPYRGPTGERTDLVDLALAWVGGASIDWTLFQDPQDQPKRYPGLPTYPFATTTFEPEARAPVAVARAVPQPQVPSVARQPLYTVMETVVARVFGVSPDDLRKTSFQDLGLNSVNAVALMDEINRALATNFPTSLAFEFNDLDALCTYVAEQKSRGPVSAPAMSRAPGSVVMNDDIAIIGLACRAADAADADAFWQIIRDGRDAMQALSDPEALAEYQREVPGAKPPRFGAIPGAEHFDSAFFKISPYEASAMHPAQRVLLEECYHALEDAGYDPATLGGQSVATVIGTNALPPQSAYTAHALLGADTSVMAARIAYFLNLSGPALAIDTACSSSLVAIDTAVRLIQSGAANMALAGGITVYSHPGIFAAMEALGIVSPSRSCRPFDRDADGMLLGEGVGVVVLKRLSDARRDGDPIHGIIRASGTNQDGRTSGLTAPSYRAQRDLISKVLAQSGVDAEKLSYLETHGTGTNLGDPIEIQAVNEALGGVTARRNYCAIGSLKANIGHATAAAGVLGLIKLLLAMRHGQLPPAVNFQTANPQINFADSPVYVNTALKPWLVDETGRRFGAISSFGYSGTNAHMVIEYPAVSASAGIGNAPRSFNPGQQLVVLSAATREQLLEKVQKLRISLVESAWTDADLADIAYTLQVSREVMEERLAIAADTVQELTTRLATYCDGTQAGSGLWTGRRGPLAEGAASDSSLQATAAFWVKGGSVDWSLLHQGRSPRRVHLPGHVFAAQIYPCGQRPKIQPVSGQVVQQARPVDPPKSLAVDAPLAVVEQCARQWWDSHSDLLQPETVERAWLMNVAINSMTREILLGVLQQQGLFCTLAQTFTLTELSQRLHSEESQSRLLAALVDMLVDHDVLQWDGDRIQATPKAVEFAQRRRETGLDQEIASLGARYGEIETFLPFMKNCIEAIPDLLAGRRQPHEVLFPGGSFEALTSIYSGNESANEFITALIAATAENHARSAAPSGFSVVEIGAGTGSASRHVLPALKRVAHQPAYIYTDISKSFTHYGSRQFSADYPFVDFRPLNIETPLEQQGFALGCHDLVIASNVLHATRDIGTTLRHVAQLLKPGGMLVLLEATDVRDYFTVTFGLTSGWWTYDDKRLDHSPLLSIPMWRNALQQSGFGVVRAWPLLGGTEQKSLEAVVVARLLPPPDGPSPS